MTKLPAAVQRTVNYLKKIGLKIDIVIPVQDNDKTHIELFAVYWSPERNTEYVKFMAEMNGMGRITEYGNHIKEDMKWLENPPRFRMTKEMDETIKDLRMTGIKFNIITPVDQRLELYYEYEREGRKMIHFVCEVDGYGRIQDYGPYLREEMILRIEADKRDVVFNADGEAV